MPLLKNLCLAIGRLVQQSGLSPKAAVIANEKRRRQCASAEFEADRLDRLRHPSKYLGKWD